MIRRAIAALCLALLSSCVDDAFARRPKQKRFSNTAALASNIFAGIGDTFLRFDGVNDELNLRDDILDGLTDITAGIITLSVTPGSGDHYYSFDHTPGTDQMGLRVKGTTETDTNYAFAGRDWTGEYVPDGDDVLRAIAFDHGSTMYWREAKYPGDSTIQDRGSLGGAGSPTFQDANFVGRDKNGGNHLAGDVASFWIYPRYIVDSELDTIVAGGMAYDHSANPSGAPLLWLVMDNTLGDINTDLQNFATGTAAECPNGTCTCSGCVLLP